ncbi:MAG: hypothetical protein SF028_14505 [Candidatus Sumerlaeia bacterium]|nr:hypothetical protein [Candidatus Sumerlaeia bacterium]
MLAWACYLAAGLAFAVADYHLRPAGYARLNDAMTGVGYAAMLLGAIANAGCLLLLALPRRMGFGRHWRRATLWLGLLPPGLVLAIVAWLVIKLIASSRGLTAG